MLKVTAVQKFPQLPGIAEIRTHVVFG